MTGAPMATSIGERGLQGPEVEREHLGRRADLEHGVGRDPRIVGRARARPSRGAATRRRSTSGVDRTCRPNGRDASDRRSSVQPTGVAQPVAALDPGGPGRHRAQLVDPRGDRLPAAGIAASSASGRRSSSRSSTTSIDRRRYSPAVGPGRVVALEAIEGLEGRRVEQPEHLGHDRTGAVEHEARIPPQLEQRSGQAAPAHRLDQVRHPQPLAPAGAGSKRAVDDQQVGSPGVGSCAGMADSAAPSIGVAVLEPGGLKHDYSHQV